MRAGAKGRSADDDNRKMLSTEQERAREANRIHCKETRDRRRERERRLYEEVEVLKLCKTIVEDGPDLFSLHKPTMDAPFSFLCDNFFTRLQLRPEHMLGKPLSSIVDERDHLSLRNAIFQVLRVSEERQQQHADLSMAAGVGNEGSGGGSNGALIQLRIRHGPISCETSMSIVRGSDGLVIVTRLYNC
eukprot:g7813.t1